MDFEKPDTICEIPNVSWTPNFFQVYIYTAFHASDGEGGGQWRDTGVLMENSIVGKTLRGRDDVSKNEELTYN